MLHKKILFGVLAFSMISGFYSPSANASMDDDSSDVLYFRLGYSPVYVGEQKIDNAGTIADKTKPYKPDYDINCLGFSAAIGKSFGDDTRAEVEVSGVASLFSLSKDADKTFRFNVTGLDTNTYKNNGFGMYFGGVNVYYDINTGNDDLVPYLGGGIGLARVVFEDGSTDGVLSYPVALQLKAGVQMKLVGTVPLYAGYKFSYLPTTESKEKIANDDGTAAKSATFKSSYMLHSIDVGVLLVK